MSNDSARKKPGVLGRTLRFAAFETLAIDLKRWRVPELQALEKEKGGALVLGFVKGLRLSAGLIYAIRKIISGKRLQVHWGHLLDPCEDSCSPECDVIIHKEGFVEEWNGHEDRVMDFKFIKCEKAIAVISCKSYAKGVDDDYPKKLSGYIKNVFLFAECCSPRRYETLRKKAQKAGYRDFCCLYTYDDKTGVSENVPDKWEEFMKAILQVATQNRSRKKLGLP